MAGQFREPGRAEQLEVAAFEVLIDAEYTETRRLGSTAAGAHLPQPDAEAAQPAATTQETT